MGFTNSSGFSIKGDNAFHHVEGSQVNGAIKAGNVYFNSQARVHRTKYNEFEYVKTGDIVTVKTLHTQNLTEWDQGLQKSRPKAQRTVYTIELHPNRRSKYTAVMYEGEEAHKAWKKAFKFPGVAQLFGINRFGYPKWESKTATLTTHLPEAKNDLQIHGELIYGRETCPVIISHSEHIKICHHLQVSGSPISYFATQRPASRSREDGIRFKCYDENVSLPTNCDSRSGHCFQTFLASSWSTRHIRSQCMQRVP
ncbi:hypothetical protein Moror_1725 [Moniliophthora roreri MCA 2997]|uniref:Uncharacterized protein n=1 Tax=Moniliophthora roreri (strain MCA 2997) TaxID=1381753 RepID=V2YP35_MONRO|nr:hypothetical protein Moror_1725 [Moniliophthora roreri MCA 2997]